MHRTSTLPAQRSTAMRRLRRRTLVTAVPYCATNGCATILAVDHAAQLATCPICGYRRRLS